MPWYLKNSNQSVYGPVSLETLTLWAEDGRMGPDGLLSEDQKSWTPAPELPPLGMDWIVTLPDDTESGPLNLLALREAIENGTLLLNSPIRHKITKDISFVGEKLLEKLLQHNRQLQEDIDHIQEELDENPPSHSPSEADDQTSLHTRWKQSVQHGDRLEKELLKWKHLYEKERDETQKKLQALEIRIHEIQQNEAAETNKCLRSEQKLKQLKVQHLELKSTLEDFAEQSENEQLREAGRRLFSLIESHQDLSLNYEATLKELAAKREEIQLLLEIREQTEKEARVQIESMSALLTAARKEAGTARKQKEEAEENFEQLRQSYRQLNERYIGLRQNKRSPRAADGDGNKEAPPPSIRLRRN